MYRYCLIRTKSQNHTMMNTAIRIFILLALPAVIFAQRPLPELSLTPRTGPQTKLVLPKSVPEIVEPNFVNDTCFTNREQGLTAYYDDYELFEGFITGSNTLSDQEKIQRLVYTGGSTFQINSVLTYLLVEQPETINDGFLYAVVYEEPEAPGEFGDPIGVSDTLFVDDIDFSNIIEFPFSTPVVATNDSFLVGINFSGVYEESADTTGYIGVASTFLNCGNVNNVYEKFTDGTQFGYDLFNEYWNTPIELYIAAVVDTEITATRGIKADYGAVVAPNPAGQIVQVSFMSDGGGNYIGTLSNTNGSVVRRTVPQRISGRNQIEWQVGDLPDGLYFYHIDGPDGRQTGKLMVH
ncbi:T9SS type A sorting domain-containing protein [Lewinella sp. IMCC34191]|uniref:T9SS type A sorting domain-containing protein n=1 Tax=Lewinella sp. IMCC34191 TaxID=2259172 RepID=UPI000E280755|nr:T9SS type A sorting domain-containing protein [Lewinella sp. IMCC34191]